MTAPEPGVRVHVADLVVERVAAARARRVPGVVALPADPTRSLIGRAGAVLHRDPRREPSGGALPADGVRAQVRGATVGVTVTVVTRLGHSCRDVAVAVQVAVADEVRAVTGLEATVQVVVADVLLD